MRGRARTQMRPMASGTIFYGHYLFMLQWNPGTRASRHSCVKKYQIQSAPSGDGARQAGSSRQISAPPDASNGNGVRSASTTGHSAIARSAYFIRGWHLPDMSSALRPLRCVFAGLTRPLASLRPAPAAALPHHLAVNVAVASRPRHCSTQSLASMAASDREVLPSA